MFGGELHLVALADEQETDAVIRQRLVYAGCDVFVAAAVGLGMPLLEPGRHGWAGQGNHQAALQVQSFQEDFHIVGGLQGCAGLAFAGDEGVAAAVAGLKLLHAFLFAGGDGLVVDVLQAAEGIFQSGHLGLHLLPVVLQGGCALRVVRRGAEDKRNQQQLATAPVLLRSGALNAAEFLSLP